MLKGTLTPEFDEATSGTLVCSPDGGWFESPQPIAGGKVSAEKTLGAYLRLNLGFDFEFQIECFVWGNYVRHLPCRELFLMGHQMGRPTVMWLRGVYSVVL